MPTVLQNPRPDIVAEAVEALKAFGPMTQIEAAKMLPMWSRARELTALEYAAVVDSFISTDIAILRTLEQIDSKLGRLVQMAHEFQSECAKHSGGAR